MLVQPSRVRPWILLVRVVTIIGLFSSPMTARSAKANGALMPILILAPQLTPNLPVITASNVQTLIEIASLCASADDCGYALAWSPDSRQLAVGGTTGIDLFDVRHLDQPPKHIPAPLRRFEQFSPDWSLLAIINGDGSVDIWNVVTAEKKFSIPLTNPNIGALEFNPTGQYLALTSYDYSIRLWDVKTNTQVHIWADHQNNDPYSSFSPDGSVFAVIISPTVQSQAIQLWDIKTGQSAADLKIEDFEPIISQIAFSPDSRMLVVSSNLNTTVWNAKTYTKLFVLNMVFNFDWALGSVFSPDSKILAAFGRQRIYLWDVTTQKQIALIDGLGLDGVSVQFGTDGSWLFSTDQSDTDFKPHVRLWDSTSGKKLSDFANEQSPALSPDGTLLATSEVDGSVVIRAIQ